MLVIRSDKYLVPSVCNHLICVESSNDGKKFFVERAKYVDVVNDMVFILDGLSESIVPTNGTIKRFGHCAVEDRLQQLFGTRHSTAVDCSALA